MRTPGQALAARRASERRERRSRWRLVLLVGGGVLAIYYALVLAGMRQHDASAVSLDDNDVSHPADRVTLEVEAVELDAGAGSLDLRIRPVPRGSFAESGGAELGESLELHVSSPDEPPLNFDFPARQLLDPVAATATTTSGAHGFPFDRPEARLRLQAVSGGEPVPIDVEATDETEGWTLAAVAATNDGGLDLRIDADRELLAISFALFYIVGIFVVALITVAVIGGAIARGQVDFVQVIWLGAMLVALPAVRNEMPGVPPVGTLVDLFIFLPSVVIVALALLAAIVVLAINEAVGGSEPPEGTEESGESDEGEPDGGESDHDEHDHGPPLDADEAVVARGAAADGM
jgi:Domain of unknown function (DUF4436)